MAPALPVSDAELSACAALVRAGDPDLFYAALFAKEPAREHLMVLYAFDLELSRGVARASDAAIARMRLQWWREVLDEIAAGGVPRAHEVAAPLSRLISSLDLSDEDLDALIIAREMELVGGFDTQSFGEWSDARFGSLCRLGMQVLGVEPPAATTGTAEAFGAAYILRNAIRMAADGAPTLLPGLVEADRIALANGQTTATAREAAQALARRGRQALVAARASRSSLAPIATPMFLPLWRAERVLEQAGQADFDLARHLVPPRGRMFAYLWRAATGRW